ncbi:hypothetical protein ACDZ94_25755 (plasmid) [Pseudomonas sp. UBT]|uniref:hypothetical protein n=1 Tax=Pseudomonas sp. UBT TaxID=3239198 RepID=UPI003D8050EC
MRDLASVECLDGSTLQVVFSTGDTLVIEGGEGAGYESYSISMDSSEALVVWVLTRERGLVVRFNILLVLLLTGCVTNQLHFAAFTTDAELSAIKNIAIHSAVTSVSGYERCTHCSESSKVVWHAANYNVGLYEDFANVPVTDWSEFTKQSIGSDASASIKTRVEIDRVFVKTWNSPDYYACEARLSVYIGTAKYTGQSRVKIKRAGQELVRQDLAYLRSETLNTVSLALKAAYIDALGDIGKVPQ